MPIFYIKTTASRPTIYECELEDFQELLDDEGLGSLSELNPYDWKIFETEPAAEAWLKRYLFTLRGLNNGSICLSRQHPAILYKRRYIVQTLMREKMQTFRSYRKNWEPGQLFNLHDQVYFLTVRLKRITETPDGFRYDFELP